VFGSREKLKHFDRLIRITGRLVKVEVGSAAADTTIHEAAGQTGPVPPYTVDEAAARVLLPPGFEWMDITPTAGWIDAPCRRSVLSADGQLYPQSALLSKPPALSSSPRTAAALGYS
jgi:hypothetical protein